MKTIVKVGGSLFDLPDLSERLRRFLAGVGTSAVLLVPGGGITADAVRQLDRVHGLGEEASHWLALRAMSVNAHFLARLLPETEVIGGWQACPPLWDAGRVPILDAYEFARADEGEPGCLPHRWDVTSDSVAARAAVVGGARWLVLLKSVTLPERVDWNEAGERGWVDAFFANALCGTSLEVRAVNLRASGGR